MLGIPFWFAQLSSSGSGQRRKVCRRFAPYWTRSVPPRRWPNTSAVLVSRGTPPAFQCPCTRFCVRPPLRRRAACGFGPCCLVTFCRAWFFRIAPCWSGLRWVNSVLRRRTGHAWAVNRRSGIRMPPTENVAEASPIVAARSRCLFGVASRSPVVCWTRRTSSTPG